MMGRFSDQTDQCKTVNFPKTVNMGIAAFDDQ
jgi:hypothetical protein